MTVTPAPSSTPRRPWRARVAAVAVLAVGAGALTLAPGAAPTAAAAGLVPWPDCDALVAHYRTELARTATPYGLGAGGALPFPAPMTAEAGAAESGAPALAADGSATGGAVGTGPTGTNLQEAGVDEPDTVKLTDDLVLASAGGRLQVLRTGATPELLSSLPLGDGRQEGSVGAEMLVDGTRVLAVSSGFRPGPGGQPGLPETRTGSLPIDQPYGQEVVQVVLVDLADPAQPRVLETLELDGRYVSARLVDGTVRLVTSSTPSLGWVSPAEPYGPLQEQAALGRNRRTAQRLTVDQVLPAAVRRGPDGREISRERAVDCADVRHSSSAATGGSTLLVTTLRPAGGLGAVDRTAVTTDGDLVYASADRLYVATSRWGTVGPSRPADSPVSSAPGGTDEVTTEVHAFDTSSPDRTPLVASGSVSGYLSGRWALSEHEGHLRVASTSQPPWDGSARSSSSVTVLAEAGGELVERGRLDGLGPGERIHAVRYFGDLAAVVTFRQTDPLYVLDLSVPARPRRVGELKIPGFSTYLHPVGDDRLLGVGHDADASGRVTGFQLSLFDLSDLSRPTQVDRLPLGEGGSVAADDSRAFGYDPQRGLAVLPFTSYDTATGAAPSSALGVRVTADGLVEAGRLEVGPQTTVERVLLDGDLAYAVTSQGVVAVRSASLTRTGSAAFAGA